MELPTTQSIEIRETTLEDIPELRIMHGRSWRDTYPNEKYDVSSEWIEERTASWITPEGIKDSIEHFKTICGNPNHFHNIAITDNKIVGMVHASKNGNGQHLEALYVDKNYHGSGLGRALMEKALGWCDPSHSIDLEVATYNERAKAFYRKYNFEEKAGSEQKFAGIIPVVTMEKKGENDEI